MHYGGVAEDLYLGSSCLTIDQLKVGQGIRDWFTLLKDNIVVGKIQVQSTYIRESGPNTDYYDTL